jgi:hypothetical protein
MKEEDKMIGKDFGQILYKKLAQCYQAFWAAMCAFAW